MKRLYLAVLAGITLLVVMPVYDIHAQSVNNFKISSYDISYELSRDSENRSVLKTTETITAQFPNFNQNRGIERALPDSYDGHPVDLKMESITNGRGEALEYTTSGRNGNTVYRIGDPDTYVKGMQVYKLVYTQRDVTRFFQDTNSDEWYWDTNGTDWRVPIQRLTISVSIDKALQPARAGKAASCYIGSAGSNDRCELLQNGEGGYSVVATNLQRGENVTLAFGFTPNTFAVFEPTLWMKILPIWVAVSVVTSIISLIYLIALTAAYNRRSNRTKELHTVPAQYIPPKDVSVTASSLIWSAPSTAFSAQLLDFAVRRIITIIEVKPSKIWSVGEYALEVKTDPSGLSEEEREILSDIFGSLPTVGSRVELSSVRNDMAYYKRISDNRKKFQKLVEDTYGLRSKSPDASKYFYRRAIAALVFGILLLLAPLLFVALFAVIYGAIIRPLTDKGLELRRYLLGLKKYIDASETERIAFLQGPDTAEKVGEPVYTDDQGQMLKLYERVLPYAVLFGLEKKWAKQLEQSYQATGASPDWYSGTAMFNAALFTTTLSNFTTATAYSVGTSSSSGGSSGGGYSGGGGGGGGGGGW